MGRVGDLGDEVVAERVAGGEVDHRHLDHGVRADPAGDTGDDLRRRHRVLGADVTEAGMRRKEARVRGDRLAGRLEHEVVALRPVLDRRAGHVGHDPPAAALANRPTGLVR